MRTCVGLSIYRDLLTTLDYSPHRDTLIHVGDLTTRGPQSLEVLDFVASRKILGVRGNHDQSVVGWRAWIEWILSHNGGLEWLDKQERLAEEGRQNSTDERRDEEGGFLFTRKDEWKEIPEGRSLMGKHYIIARYLEPSSGLPRCTQNNTFYRNMSTAAASYLYSLPLALHIPQLHTFIVHGGLLPFDPREDITAETQPLARLPSLDSHKNKNDPDLISTLRRTQERSLLQDVEQNTDPWSILNIRGITSNDEVTKSALDHSCIYL